jgi:ribonucleoside-diphosphate reductase alpha chain
METSIKRGLTRKPSMGKVEMMIGPRNLVSQQLHAAKYRQKGETFDDYCVRYARTTADDEIHFRKLLEGLRTQAILPAGRQQRAVGWPFQTTAFNCFVGGIIPDTTRGIGESLTEAMLTLRSGGGCGWDFGTLRPEGEPVRGLGDDAYASGPVSFMGMWHSMCNTIRSAGERRGAMMGVLPVCHPDILTFVRAKQNEKALTNFNISVGVTNAFMEAVQSDGLYDLKFDGRVIRTVRALDIWAVIMEVNWDWAEPGILFLDVINQMNPLQYCELITATNPCAEQPLPPNGACLLLSHNMVKYVVPAYKGAIGNGGGATTNSKFVIDLDKLARDVEISVRACDNVFEKTVYPLEAYRTEALNKRRMGIGVTGMANALEVCGLPYASDEYIAWQSHILSVVRDTAYRTSISMARTKGPFPLFDADKWLASGFSKTLPDDIRHGIKKHGLRNGLLLSIAPTGTISLTADNVSSGIEPPPALEINRVINFADGPRTVSFNDYAVEEYGVRGLRACDVAPHDHIRVLCEAQKYVDSSISKTVNVRGAKTTPPGHAEISFHDFKDLYLQAFKGGAKGCTTFNENGRRQGIITERTETHHTEDHAPGSNGQANAACYFDPATGSKVCG